MAASQALIVTGIAGNSANAEEFQRLALETKRLLAERGIPANRIELLTGKVSRDQILEKLRAAADTPESDEFWLVLYGHSGKSQGGVPAFQVSGPRLTAKDIQETLDAIPARQTVFIATSESGAFLPLLQNPKRTVISATKGGGESDQPRFPAHWIEALAENPKASIAWTAARAAELTSQEYTHSSLAQIEHARLADPATGKILEPPFGVNLEAAPETTFTVSSGDDAPSAQDIQVKIKDPTAEWEHQPATAETQKIIAEARAVPNPEGYSAIVLEQKLGFTVEEDRTTDQLTKMRVFIAREDAADDWANYFLPQAPPAITTKLEYARVIHPDGSSIAFNPAKLPGTTTPDESGDSAAPMVYLPETGAGCVVEVGWRTRQILDATLPHVSVNLPLQRAVPILKTSLDVRVPEKPAYRVALNHFESKSNERVENGRRIFSWQLDHLPAAENLPGDPPAPLWEVSLGISSLPSWEEFAAWYRRLAQDSDAIDDTVKKAAASIVTNAPSRREKIHRSFEFVSALRYIAVEIGVQGFRPRTPARVLANRYGDCKDKANLLGAMLRSQGIDARFVLLNRGSFTDVNFPSWQFNHAICLVPGAPGTDQPDDLWLDSTDSTAPFGFVPPGDYGRAGLVFTPTKAEFKTVSSQNKSGSETHDDWNLTQLENGGWSGTWTRVATGFAEDGLRRQFRGITPQQRQFNIYHIATELWPAADFSDAVIGDVSDLRAAAQIRTKVVSGSAALPPANFSDRALFSPPQRDRPLLLNDGQPMSLRQTVLLRYTAKPPALPAAWQKEVAGEKLSITWRQVDANTIERTALLELHQPLVPAADYAALRQALREWDAAQH